MTLQMLFCVRFEELTAKLCPKKVVINICVSLNKVNVRYLCSLIYLVPFYKEKKNISFQTREDVLSLSHLFLSKTHRNLH